MREWRLINLVMDKLSVRSYSVSSGDAQQANTDLSLDFSRGIYVKSNMGIMRCNSQLNEVMKNNTIIKKL